MTERVERAKEEPNLTELLCGHCHGRGFVDSDPATYCLFMHRRTYAL